MSNVYYSGVGLSLAGFVVSMLSMSHLDGRHPTLFLVLMLMGLVVVFIGLGGPLYLMFVT